MGNWTIIRSFLIIEIVALALPCVGTAKVIISVGTDLTPEGASAISNHQYVGFSFRITGAYSNASIAAYLCCSTTGVTGTAYLTTAIGPGTTASAQIATAPIPAETALTLVTVFPAGLNLGPGTYYVTFAGTADNPLSPTGLGLQFMPHVSITTDTGVTHGSDFIANSNSAAVPGTSLNTSYPPASTFSTGLGDGTLLYVVVGNPSSTGPAPVPLSPSLILSIIGLGIVGLWQLRRRNTRRPAIQ